MRGRANTSGYQESGTYELLPDGDYKVKIVECGEKLTKAQDPMIAVTFEIIEGEFSGRKLFDNIILPNEGSPASKIWGRTKHFLHVISEPYEGDIEWDSGRWLFKKCFVEVFTDTYEGKKRNKISNYILPEGDFNPSDVDNGQPAGKTAWEEEGPNL